MSSTYYAVHKGREPGVYSSWTDVNEQVSGFSNAKFKRFSSLENAEIFVKTGEDHSKILSQAPLSKYFHLNRLGGLEKYGLVVTQRLEEPEEDNILFKDIDGTQPTKENPWADFPLEGKIVVFTDGSCISYKNMSKGGIGIHFPQEFISDVSTPLPDDMKATNQRAELFAIYKALELIINSTTYTENERRQDIYIYSDSQYSIKCMTTWISKWITNDWKTSKGGNVLNVDLIKPMYELYSKHRVHLKHIRAHTGKSDRFSIGNHIAERLAFKACSDKESEN